MVLLVYLLGRRLGGPGVGLLAALLAAIYPTFIDNSEQILSEPIAAFTLTAAMLGFLWASDPGRPIWAWLVPGAMLGATALARPEYLPFVAVLGAGRAGEGRRSPRLQDRVCLSGALRGRVLHGARSVGAPQLPGPGPLRSRDDRRRQGAVRRHLPARQGTAAAGQARADQALHRQGDRDRPRGRATRR